MVLTLAHFLSEQKSLQPYSFIPLSNWHKLINVFLLLEQCSLVLYIGGLTPDAQNVLFGLNLLLILVLQEKDSVHGEIKYSVIPLALNNLFLFATNFTNIFSSARTPSKTSQVVNRQKVGYGMVWYAGSLFGYALMEKFEQGLNIKSSEEMFIFTAAETLFMVSMALCYFYTW